MYDALEAALPALLLVAKYFQDNIKRSACCDVEPWETDPGLDGDVQTTGVARSNETEGPKLKTRAGRGHFDLLPTRHQAHEEGQVRDDDGRIGFKTFHATVIF